MPTAPALAQRLGVVGDGPELVRSSPASMSTVSGTWMTRAISVTVAKQETGAASAYAVGSKPRPRPVPALVVAMACAPGASITRALPAVPRHSEGEVAAGPLVAGPEAGGGRSECHGV
jgi:hypothetical protein